MKGFFVTEEDFDILYVDCFEIAPSLRLVKRSNKPLLLGGQIGSGKSTLIEKVA